MDEMREAISSALLGTREIRQVTEYEVDASGRPLKIRLMDDGGFSNRRRYTVEASWADLPLDERHNGNDGYCMGTDEDTIALAVARVHWWKFDSKE